MWPCRGVPANSGGRVRVAALLKLPRCWQWAEPVWTDGGLDRAWASLASGIASRPPSPTSLCSSRHPPQAALPAEVFQGFIAALKPKQQQRLQEVLSA